MSVCQSPTALLTQDPSRDSSASRHWWPDSRLCPQRTPGTLRREWLQWILGPSRTWVPTLGLEGLFQKPSQRWSQGLGKVRPQALPPALPPFQKNLGRVLRMVPRLKVLRHHVLHIFPPRAPSALRLKAQHTMACLPNLPERPGLSPALFPPSLRLATAMVAQGQARTAEEEPVEGDPYEWVLIWL